MAQSASGAEAMTSTAMRGNREHLGRSYLYGMFCYACQVRHIDVPLVYGMITVPTTAERMLEKSLTTPSDVIIYDLEDSVPPSPADKKGARDRLTHFLTASYFP